MFRSSTSLAHNFSPLNVGVISLRVYGETMSKDNIGSFLFWLHSSCSVTSMTFFLALISASDLTKGATEIQIAAMFMMLSLVFNSFLTFFIMSLKPRNKFISFCLTSPRLLKIEVIAIICFGLGIATLLSHFSYLLFFAFIVTIVFISFYGYSALMKQISLGFRKLQAEVEDMSTEEKEELWSNVWK